MKFRDCRYVIFDLDGTLTDPRAGITGSAVYALRKLGYPTPEPSEIEWFIARASLVFSGAYRLHGSGGQTA